MKDTAKTDTTEPTLCLRPGCDQLAKIRGLCKTDHSRAHRLVKLNKATWAELEASGKVLPAKTTFGQGSADSKAATAWFTDSAKTTTRESATTPTAPASSPPPADPKGKPKGPKLMTTPPVPEAPSGLLSQLATGTDTTVIPGVTRRMVD